MGQSKILIRFENGNFKTAISFAFSRKLNNMKKIILIVAVAVSLMSCAGKSPETDKTIIPAGAATPVLNNSIVEPAKVQPIVVNPVSSQPVLTSAPVSTLPVANNKGGAGPNPAHGQPGHRCDIAVGAPLNSPATNTAKPTVQTISTAPTSAAQAPAIASPVSTDPNAKLNPAHGQPGHDCSIAVGAPLKKS